MCAHCTVLHGILPQPRLPLLLSHWVCVSINSICSYIYYTPCLLREKNHPSAMRGKPISAFSRTHSPNGKLNWKQHGHYVFFVCRWLMLNKLDAAWIGSALSSPQHASIHFCSCIIDFSLSTFCRDGKRAHLCLPQRLMWFFLLFKLKNYCNKQW